MKDICDYCKREAKKIFKCDICNAQACKKCLGIREVNNRIKFICFVCENMGYTMIEEYRDNKYIDLGVDKVLKEVVHQ